MQCCGKRRHCFKGKKYENFFNDVFVYLFPLESTFFLYIIRYMYKNSIKKNVFLYFLLLFFKVPSFSAVFQTARVLFISSYNYDWESIPKQLAGISDTLNRYAELDYIFMDTKHLPYEHVKPEVFETIKYKISQNGAFDYIITGDDAALAFALEYQDRLFKDIPIFFEGINSEKYALEAAEDPLVTGVIETFHMEDTIRLAYSIYPAAKRVVGITDMSLSGQGSTMQFLECQKDFPSLEFETLNTFDYTDEELGDKIAGYNHDTILFFLLMTSDKTGKVFSSAEAAKFLSEKACIPIFKSDELGIGNGITGGMVISYYNMAARAAEMVRSCIINGKSAHNFPPENTQCSPTFDSIQLKRFKIFKDLLPVNSVIINEKINFFEKYKLVLIPSFLVIIILIVYIFLFFLYIRKKQLLMLKMSEAQRQSEINKTRTRFLSSVSHDMRTPLNGIIGIAGILRRENTDPEKEKYLSNLEDASEYLLNLVNDTLDISSLENFKFELHPSVCLFDDILKNALTLIYPSFSTKKITFKKNFDPIETVPVYIDKNRIRQAFINILGNAIKFSSENSIIEITSKNLPAPENTIIREITVRDYGIGMSKEFLPRIFEPFAQEHTEYNTKYSGTGLGLAIVKTIITKSGGSISVESELGKGTAITVTLVMPVATPEQIAGEKEKKSISLYKALSGRRILLCEDNTLNILIATEILKKKNLLVEVAENGEKGRNLFLRSKPGYFDAILMDIRMPVMDGLESTRCIRNSSHADAKSIPIIALTANTSENERADMKKAGMDGCITKPFVPDDIYRTLQEHILSAG